MAREPLPYPHDYNGVPTHVGSLPVACTRPEWYPSPGVGYYSDSDHCPGCRAFALALAVGEPERQVSWVDPDGLLRRGRLIDFCVGSLDEFDPMRVLFERELARRDIT